MAEQPGGSLDPADAASVNKHKLSPAKVLNQATSPTLPALSESVGDSVESRSDDGSHSSTESLSPTADDKKNSGKKSKIRPKSLPSGYVNASYQREEEDHDHHEREQRNSPVSPQRKSRESSVESEKRGFQPYRKDGSTNSIVALISSVQEVDVTEAAADDLKDQYSKGRRTPVGSVSNASLPSITEEKFEISNVETFTSISTSKDRHPIYRPASVPSESFYEGFPLSPHISRATSLPLSARDTHNQYYQTSKLLHPDYNGLVFQNRDERNESLLERRQQPELFLRSFPNQTSQPRQQELPSNPSYQGVITSPNGKHYTFDALNRFNSLSGLDRISSFTGIERLSSFSEGDYPLNADDSLLYSPHTPSSFDIQTTKTRDTATSPFITTWDESDEAPDLISAEYRSDPPLTSSLIENSGKSRNSSPSEIEEVQNAIKSGNRKASEVELRPISRVEDQEGRKYSLYAIPTALEGLVFYAPAPEIHIHSGELSRRESRKSDGGTRISTDGKNLKTDEEKLFNEEQTSNALGKSRTGNYSDIDSYENLEEMSYRTLSDHSLHTDTSGSDRDSNDGSRMRAGTFDSDHEKEQTPLSLRSKRQGSPKLQRTDSSVIYNGHEPLHQKLSGNFHVAKRPTSLPSPDRRRARAIFFGDSGISSVGSGSTNSLSHSLELDNESKERKENAANILNPIKETEVENPANKSILSRMDSISGASADRKTPVTTSVNIMLPTKKSRENHVIDILSNSDLYESSVV